MATQTTANTTTIKPLITVKGFEVSIAVKDLDSTAKWYRDNLGFQIVQTRDFPDYGTRIVFMESGPVRMELIEDKKWTPIKRPNPPLHTTVAGVSQISFFVDDIEAVAKEVKNRPIEIAWDIITVEDLRMKEFFIRDNEGNIVQFIERF